MERHGWTTSQKKDGVVPKFSFHEEQITATPNALKGPGWDAAINGQHSVSCNMSTGIYMTVSEACNVLFLYVDQRERFCKQSWKRMECNVKRN